MARMTTAHLALLFLALLAARVALGFTGVWP